MQTLLERLSSGGVLVSDGATGSLLQSAGLPAGASPESWCLSRPEVVRGVAEAYLAAGSDMVLTNSFGGSPLKLARHGLAERAGEVNRVAATLAREAAGSGKFVAGSVGPTGRIVWDEGGDVTPAELYEAFREQVDGLADGGVDAICVETMSSLAEALEAVNILRNGGQERGYDPQRLPFRRGVARRRIGRGRCGGHDEPIIDHSGPRADARGSEQRWNERPVSRRDALSSQGKRTRSAKETGHEEE